GGGGAVPGAGERAEDPDGPARDSGEVAQRGGSGTGAGLLRLEPRAAEVDAFNGAVRAERDPVHDRAVVAGADLHAIPGLRRRFVAPGDELSNHVELRPGA